MEGAEASRANVRPPSLLLSVLSISSVKEVEKTRAAAQVLSEKRKRGDGRKAEPSPGEEEERERDITPEDAEAEPWRRNCWRKRFEEERQKVTVGSARGHWGMVEA